MHKVVRRKAWAPISTNSATVTDTAVDTLGYDYATIELSLGVVGGAATAFDIHFTAADNTAVAAANQVFGAAGSTGDARLVQTADAGESFIYHINLGTATTTTGTALTAGARYLQFVFTTGATTLSSCTVWLSRGSPTADTSLEYSGGSTGARKYIN